MICIADLLIEWDDDRRSFIKDFVAESYGTPVMRIDFRSSLPECHSVKYTDRLSDRFLCADNGGFLFANKDWSEATSYLLPESNADYTLPLAAICSRFSYYNALLAHSSFVIYRGKGIVFTGYSGVGKTTQAELWAKYMDAEIVNGDKVLIRETGGRFYAYGLPWKGSSEYCLNKKAELCGVVVLRQSEKNRITRLDEAATEYFMPHIFLPHWDKECLNSALDTFDKLIGNVPVYLLECRPDEEAVEITKTAVFG